MVYPPERAVVLSIPSRTASLLQRVLPFVGVRLFVILFLGPLMAACGSVQDLILTLSWSDDEIVAVLCAPGLAASPFPPGWQPTVNCDVHDAEVELGGVAKAPAEEQPGVFVARFPSDEIDPEAGDQIVVSRGSDRAVAEVVDFFADRRAAAQAPVAPGDTARLQWQPAADEPFLEGNTCINEICFQQITAFVGPNEVAPWPGAARVDGDTIEIDIPADITTPPLGEFDFCPQLPCDVAVGFLSFRPQIARCELRDCLFENAFADPDAVFRIE